MAYLLVIVSGFLLGFVHAFEIDHLVAVTAFASKKPHPRRAAAFGIVWGLGHTATLLIIGLISLAFKFAITPKLESAAEVAVGLLLIAVGVWVLAGVFRRQQLHVHRHDHDGVEHTHLHSHAHDSGHHHHHSMFLIGATHGFAGSASVLVIIPLVLTQSLISASLYLLLFGLGTMTAMGTFAYILGKLTHSLQTSKALRFVQAGAGFASICTGFFWIAERLL